MKLSEYGKLLDAARARYGQDADAMHEQGLADAKRRDRLSNPARSKSARSKRQRMYPYNRKTRRAAGYAWQRPAAPGNAAKAIHYLESSKRRRAARSPNQRGRFRVRSEQAHMGGMHNKIATLYIVVDTQDDDRVMWRGYRAGDATVEAARLSRAAHAKPNPGGRNSNPGGMLQFRDRFDTEAAAQREAASLRAQGYGVTVEAVTWRGATAYEVWRTMRPLGKPKPNRRGRNPRDVSGEHLVSFLGGLAFSEDGTSAKTFSVRAAADKFHRSLLNDGDYEVLKHGARFVLMYYGPLPRANPSRSKTARARRKRGRQIVTGLPRRVRRAGVRYQRKDIPAAQLAYLAHHQAGRLVRRGFHGRRPNPKGRNPARRDVPPGKILLAEYGSYPPEDRAQARVIAEGHSEKVRSTVKLVEVSPGWEMAGSVARWTNGYFAVWWWESSGTRHGQQYKDEAKAAAHFDRLTGPGANPKGRFAGF